ncbi:hypothetical protein N9D31_04060, partial [Oligoflexaceae bacterium]|nr:hypothetical protein [Oligoflexaceae bacterium]
MKILKVNANVLWMTFFIVSSFTNTAQASMRDFMEMCTKPFDNTQAFDTVSKEELSQIIFRNAGLDPLFNVHSFASELPNTRSSIKVTYIRKQTSPLRMGDPFAYQDTAEYRARNDIDRATFERRARARANQQAYEENQRQIIREDAQAKADAEQLLAQYKATLSQIDSDVLNYLRQTDETSCRKIYRNIIKTRNIYVSSLSNISDLNHLKSLDEEINFGRIDGFGYYYSEPNAARGETLDVSAIAGLTGLKKLFLISDSPVSLGQVDLSSNKSLIELQLVGFGLHGDSIQFKDEPDYKRVNLSLNYFETLDFSAFESLEALELKGNALINIKLPTNAESLRFLDLSDNMLTLESMGGISALDNFPNLKYLDLRNNSLSDDEKLQLSSYMSERSIALPPASYDSKDMPFDTYKALLELYPEIDRDMMGLLDRAGARQ